MRPTAPALRRGAIFLLLILAPALGAQSAHAQTEPATITGHVLNGSTGNAPIAGVAVQLYQFDGSNKTIVGTVPSAADGGFSFTGLQSGAAFQYAAATVYDNVTYASAPVTLQPGDTQPADITVYATSDAGGGITVSRMSIVLAGADSKAGLISMVESYHITNSADATYIGAATGGVRTTLNFPLPAGARSLTPLDGFTANEAVTVAGGFALTTPVLPGDSVLSFTYDLPYQTRSLAMRRTLAYPTALAEVILPTDIRITSPQLAQSASIQLGNRSFDTIQATNLAAATPIELDVSGLPAQPPPIIDLSRLPVQVAILALIAALVAVGVLYERQRSGTGARSLQTRKAALLRQVAELDDRAERCDIDVATYHTERNLALAQIGELLQQLDALEKRQPAPVAASKTAGDRSQRDQLP